MQRIKAFLDSSFSITTAENHSLPKQLKWRRELNKTLDKSRSRSGTQVLQKIGILG
jgi:hypothetical protein